MGCLKYWVCCKGAYFLYCGRHLSLAPDDSNSGLPGVAGVKVRAGGPYLGGQGALPFWRTGLGRCSPEALVRRRCVKVGLFP